MDRFKKIYQQGTIDVVEIWVDTQTGVNYVFHRNGNAAGFKQSRKSIPYLVILLLGAVRFVVFDNDLPGVILFMFITFMAVYWVGVFAKKRIGAGNAKDKISSLFIWDILNQLLNVPFSHFACAFFTARFCASVLAILSPLSGIIFCVLQNVAWLAMEHSTNT